MRNGNRGVTSVRGVTVTTGVMRVAGGDEGYRVNGGDGGDRSVTGCKGGVTMYNKM